MLFLSREKSWRSVLCKSVCNRCCKRRFIALFRITVYRFTRNPIYLGMAFMLIGFPLAFGNVWGIPLVAAFIPLMNNLVIRHEEAYLEKKFGEAYTGYKSRVRRWLS